MAKAKKAVVVAKAIDTSGTDIGSADSVRSFGSTSLPMADLYWMLFSKHPWVNACANIIAKTISADGYSLQQGDDDDGKLLEPNVPVSADLRTFLENAWPATQAVRTWRRALKSVALDRVVYGSGYWLKKRAGKNVVGLERLDPRLVFPKANKDRTEIEVYKLKRVSNDISLSGQGVIDLSPEDVIHFCDGGGDNLLGAESPLEALDMTLLQDLSLRKFREAFFRHGGVAGTVLVNTEAKEDQMKAAERMIKRSKVGTENAYKVWMLAGAWTVNQKAKAGDNDFDFVKASGLTREDICAVYHVPVGKLIFSDKALGSAGKAEDDNTFQEQCVLPIEESIYETITMDLLQGEFELGDVRMVPRRRSRVRMDMIDSAVKLLNMGGTGNEARALINMPPSDKPGMDIPMFLSAKGLGVASDEAGAAAGGSDKLDSANTPKDNSEVAKTEKAGFRFPNPHKFRKQVQREIGRLHEKLNAIVLPHFKTAKAKSPDDWQNIEDAMLTAIEESYGVASGIGKDAIEAYHLPTSAHFESKLDAAAKESVARARAYIRSNLRPYLSQVYDDLQDGTRDEAGAVEAVQGRLELYAEPTWGVFQQAQREGFEEQSGMLLEWDLDPASEHCADCPDIAAGSPYTLSNGDNPIPSWPGDGATSCEVRCNCSVQPEENSWEHIIAPIREQQAEEAAAEAASYT